MSPYYYPVVSLVPFYYLSQGRKEQVFQRSGIVSRN
jgi:hypothetical protein